MRCCTVGSLALLLASSAAPAAEARPAPANPFHGMQEREEVFAFTERPKAEKQDDTWVITFASKATCDATVSIIGPDGQIIRHLASGVLGKNAPYPFGQGLLAQRLEWDGLTDDFKKAPAGCSARVSLGLKATYERSILWDPYDISGDREGIPSGTGPDGNLYVGSLDRSGVHGRVFDTNGKYVRTFCPAPAAEVEKDGKAPPKGYGGMVVQERYMGVVAENGGIPPVTTTAWGDKVMISSWFGPFSHPKILDARFAALGVRDVKKGRRPATLRAAKPSVAGAVFGKISRVAVDREKELLYAGFSTVYRLDGKTGELDATWFPKGEMGGNVSEFYVGADGLLYLRVGGSSYGQHLFRLDRAGKVVPYEKNTVPVPVAGWWNWRPKAFRSGDLGAVFCGVKGHSNTFQQGMHVSPNGLLVTSIHEVSSRWAVEKGLAKAADVKGPEIPGTYIIVWSPRGDLLTVNAVEGRRRGNGVAMDRDGNIYVGEGVVMPAGQTSLDGTPHFRAGARVQGGYGTLFKFRGQGGTYPVGKIVWTKETAAPEGAIKLSGGYATGALWAYGGLTGHAAPNDCLCHHQRFDLDPWARLWIPANHLYSVMVLDSNGNRIARLGRYGNVDDTEADIKAGRDGLRFCWPRAIAASDTALYVADTGNRRILKAGLSYAADETVPLR